MAATSVTGTGPGSAEGAIKGDKEFSMGVEKLIGPRVVYAGQDTLSGGTLAVVLPVLDGVAGDYIAVCTDVTAAQPVKAVITLGSNDTTLTLTGTSTDVINWAIIKVGLS